jgi:DNA-binding NarL/FixJ family response regulator
MKLFLVEDSAIIRQRLEMLVQGFPQIAITGQFENAGDAIQGIAQAPPDVILLDLELGATSGLDVLRHTSQYFPDIKVIVLTNHADPRTRAQCVNLGAHLFLDKSLEFAKVTSALLAIGP